MLWLLDISAYRDPCRRAICVYMTRKEGEQLQLLNGPDTFSVVAPHASIQATPTLELAEETAQALVDALAQQGIRPSIETRAEQKALDAHLQDMRHIALKQLGFGEAT